MIFKCKMCGGALELADGASVAECPYCGAKQTLPKLDDERRANLFDRANHFRRTNDFDKAMALYEEILKDDPNDAEVYWSIVLCRYGIEYVEDPATHKRIPTVNRAQLTSILADEDYKSAIAHADCYQRDLYEAEANEIERIQKGILAISQKEEPFDVFICYKETDENGSRTRDSVLANDLYYELTNEGYKVFFARITLENKLGTAYEPYIFAALQSSRVMVVVGTKPEYFNAPWVKNEWSRYLALIRGGAEKTLIPAYRDMDPYDLPDAFSHLQAQDMSKLGFMQDLVRGIRKILGGEQGNDTVSASKVVVTESRDVAPLIRRAFLFLEDGETNAANEYAEKVLDINPECAEAYIIKLLLELGLRKPAELADCKAPFFESRNYQKAIRFADQQYRKTIEGYHETVMKRLNAARDEEQYQRGIEALRRQHYDEAERYFQAVPSYRDAAQQLALCSEGRETLRKDTIYTQALRRVQSVTATDVAIKRSIEELQSIRGYKDADRQVQNLEQRLARWYNDKQAAEMQAQVKAERERLERERALEQKRIQTERTKLKAKKAAKIGIPALVTIIIAVILTFTVFIPLAHYRKADRLVNAGEYEEAETVYRSLNGFAASEKRLTVLSGISYIGGAEFERGIRELLAAGVPVRIIYDAEGGAFSGVAGSDSIASGNGTTVTLLSDMPDNRSLEKDKLQSGTADVTYRSSAEFEALLVPGRSGYRFVKWDLGSYDYQIKGTFELKLKAVWSRNQYDITYDLDGGRTTGVDPTGYNVTDDTFTLTQPTKTGYSFIGWTGTDLAEPTITVTIEKGSIGNRSYTANWRANTYTVSFDPDGGTVSVPSMSVAYDQSFTLPQPVWEGHTFSGWYAGNDPFGNGVWRETSHLTLRARWDVIDYSIEYVLQGGTNAPSNPPTYTIYDEIIIAAPSKTGYRFMGWTRSEQDAPEQSVVIAAGTSGNTVLTAHWEALSYTLVFDANGGELSDHAGTVVFDSDVTLPVPKRAGYTFSGWYYGDALCKNGTWKIAADATLKASWTANRYVVTLDPDGGTVSSNTITVVFDSKYSLPAPRKTGYTFLGWYCGSSSVESSAIWKGTEHIAVKAQWKANDYIVTLDPNGGTVSDTTITVTYDGSYTLPVPARIGYTFAGWFRSGTEYAGGIWKTAYSVGLCAKWTANTDTPYIVNHYLQNAEDDDYTLELSQRFAGTSDTPVRPAIRSYIGFTSPSEQTVSVKPDGTLTVNYYYTRNLYTISFITNGGEAIGPITQKYQSALAMPAGCRAGFTFGGWFTDTKLSTTFSMTTMPISDCTVYAYWAEENKPTDFTYAGASEITVSAYVGDSTTMWIPAYIGGVPVRTISASAFLNQSALIKVVIPDTVASIGEGAFKGCAAIEDITLPFVGASADATYHDAVFGYIFGMESIDGYDNTVVGVPRGQRSNKTYTFANGYVLWNETTGIWQYSCYAGTYYTSNYPNTYYSLLSYYYFIPRSIKSVTVTVQADIPVAAFNNCDFIESIAIPSGTTSIGVGVFQNCGALKRLNSETDGMFNIPVGVTVIGDSTFSGCTEMTAVTLGGDVVSIGSYAFSGCSLLSKFNAENANELIIPGKVTSIGSHAFENVLLVTKVVVADSVTSIGEGAFKGCAAIEDITLPFVGASVDATYHDAVFGYIFGMESIDGYDNTVVGVPRGQRSNKTYTFANGYVLWNETTGIWQYSCYAGMNYTSYPNTYYSLLSYYYFIPRSIKSVTVTVQTDIPVAAFNNCDFIESINLPVSVETHGSIGDYAFQNCTATINYTVASFHEN